MLQRQGFLTEQGWLIFHVIHVVLPLTTMPLPQASYKPVPDSLDSYTYLFSSMIILRGKLLVLLLHLCIYILDFSYASSAFRT